MAARGLICVSFRFYVGDAEDTLAVWGREPVARKAVPPSLFCDFAFDKSKQISLTQSYQCNSSVRTLRNVQRGDSGRVVV